MEIPHPETEKEIRGFLGRVQYISRFVAKLTIICEPIFKKLKVREHIMWDDRYTAMGAMLAETVDKEERVIYCISKKFLDNEVKYTPLEKTCLAVVWATKKLRHYMLSYSVSVYSKMDPIKYLFEKPVLNGRMSRCTLMLSEFDLKYLPLKVIKGRAVADFLADNAIEETEVVDTWSFPDEDVVHVENDVWDLYFNGASNYMGYGVGILLISPTGEHVPVSIQLDFNVTNAAEYEACWLGLPSALDLGVKKFFVHGDSSLVTNQVRGSSKNWKNCMPICVKRRLSPAYVNAIDDAEEGEIEPLYKAILKFKETGEYPPDLDMGGKRALRILSTQFIRTGDRQL
ncbi:uncharacterized protein LOC141619004 [Silene latifolia]|uniref:uncharacterized protein LOC141619004 n=1 Tax=Silene latifolia TaxID=37657 RepID=UPI003D7756B2